MKNFTLLKKATFCLLFSFYFLNFSFGQGNTTSAGEIGYDQTIYQGEEPESFESISPASGGDASLDLEYKWIRFITVIPMVYEDAVGVNNQATYSPPPLFQNSWFGRMSRREGFTDYQWSNVITINVLPGNADYGGLIGSDQMVLINEQPDTLFEIEPAIGGNPNVGFEYEWVKLTSPSTVTLEPAEGIIDQPYYVPPPLTETTIFVRKVRRVGLTGYVQSNQIIIEVEPTSIKNFEDGIIQIYPNPVTNYLQIEFKENSSSDWQVEIFDIKGSLQKTISLENVNSIETINLQDLAKGTYLIQLMNLQNDKIESFKILKE